jgi:hypothetical protein
VCIETLFDHCTDLSFLDLEGCLTGIASFAKVVPARSVMMDINGIRQALHKEPFEAFTIRLADGRGLQVPHPDFVAVGPRRVIVVSQDNSWTVVEPLLIVSLDHDGPRPSSAS